MKTRIRHFFNLPTQLGTDEIRVAHILNIVLLSTIALNPLYCLILIFALQNPTPPLLANAFLFAVQLISLIRLKQGQISSAVLIDVTGTWLYFSFMIFIFGGSQSPGIVGYFLIVLIAGLLISSRAAYFFAALSAIFSFGVFTLEVQGLLPPSLVTLNPFYTWGTVLLGILVIAILLQLTTDNLQNALGAARQSAVDLAERNEELHLAQTQLKQKIVELQSVQEALRRSEKQLQTVIRSAPVILWGTDQDGKMSFLQGKTLEDIGFEQDQFVGDSIFTVSGGRIEGLESKIQRALQGDSFSSIELLRDRIFEIHFSPMKEDGLIKGVIGVAVDMTERHQAEEALLYTQKLESLGILAGGIAHDFNNLLSAILGQASVAMMKLDAEHPASRHIQKAVKSVQHASSLTQQMLAYSGRGRFTIELINLNELIRDNIHLFETAVTKGVFFKVSLSKQAPIVEGDASQLQQVIMNLIINAAEAIADSAGRVFLKTEIIQVETTEKQMRDWTGNSLEVGNYVLLEVSDTGQGMTSEVLSKIFDPFFTTKMTGRGLGLAAVQGIVRGHNGNLFVESEMGLGTKFKLYFPLSEVEEEVPFLESREDSQATTMEKTILLIDDDPTIREAVTDILAIYEMKVITSPDGLKGIKQYEAFSTEIDLILLDLTMPGISGLETLKRLRKLGAAVPILISSGYNKEAVEKDINEFEADDFIQKPYRAEELIDTIQTMLSFQESK